MASVCDDCDKKDICKPSKEYHFACQWKNVKGKQRIAARDEWGLTQIHNGFNARNEEEGWAAIKLSIDDVDKYIEKNNIEFDNKLSSSEKMMLIDHATKNKAVINEILDKAVGTLLFSMYGDRIVEELEESA